MAQVIAARAQMIAKIHGHAAAADYLRYRGVSLETAKWMLTKTP